MKAFAVYVSIGIFAFLSVIHIYWGLGGRWGYDTVIPVENGKPAINPSKGITLLLAAIFLLPIFIILGDIGVFSTKFSYLYRVGIWGVFIAFLMRAIGNFKNIGFFKKNKGTKFAIYDTILFSPLCLLISLLILLIAI